MRIKTWLALLGASLFTFVLAASIASAIAGDAMPFNRGSWEALRRAHAGHPTIVHFWGLACPPCLAELPQWSRFASERPGLDLVMVHAERPTGDPGRIKAALSRAGLESSESWMFADPFEERLRFEIDRDWQGELPRTLLIGRDGSVASLSGAADFDRIAAWLDGQTQAK
jgi:thiol-disulfide isomerase/thioredoxin